MRCRGEKSGGKVWTKGEVRESGRAVITGQCGVGRIVVTTVLTRVEKFKSDPFVHLTSTSYSLSDSAEFTASISTSSFPSALESAAFEVRGEVSSYVSIPYSIH